MLLLLLLLVTSHTLNKRGGYSCSRLLGARKVRSFSTQHAKLVATRWAETDVIVNNVTKLQVEVGRRAEEVFLLITKRKTKSLRGSCNETPNA